MASEQHSSPDFHLREREAAQKALALVAARLDLGTGSADAGEPPLMVGVLEDVVCESICDPNQLVFLLFEMATLTAAVLDGAGKAAGRSPQALLQEFALEVASR